MGLIIPESYVMKKLLLVAAAMLSAVTVSAQTPDLPLVYDVENTGAGCAMPPLPSVSQLRSVTDLPDPFEWSDGSGRVQSFDEWECRRNEIINEIGYYEIGVKPAPPKDVTATYSGGTLTVTVKENGKTLTLTSKVTMPSGSGPFPVVIGMNSATGSLSSSLFSGCIQIPFNHDQVATYAMTGNKDTNAPFYQMYPNLRSAGDYCAWSWGISRLIDGIFQLQEQLNADVEHIALTGCSYAGKMALFGGALDERVALTIAQESGGGGVNSWRISETIGEVEKIGNTNYSWFMQSFKNSFNSNVSKIPYDHHELIGLIAPRAVLVLGNPDYTWLGDPSGYPTTMAAIEIYKAMGIEDRIGFNFAKGHSHCQAASSQNTSCQKFIDRFLKGNTSVDTKVRENALNVDYAKWMKAWAGTKLELASSAFSARITSPSASSEIYSDQNLLVETSVKSDEEVAKVDLYLDDELVASLTETPYTFTIEQPEKGGHTLYIEVTDAAGNTVQSAAVKVDVKERKIFNMLERSELFIQTEEMPETDGQYIKPYTDQFEGMAYYANKDMTRCFVNLFPANGPFTIKVKGCADATTAANLSLYIDGEKKATYTWTDNTPTEVTKEVEVTGVNPHTFQLIMETDNGKSDAFADYISVVSKELGVDPTKAHNQSGVAVGFYPNPADNGIHITGEVFQVSIYNMLGELVLVNKSADVDLSSLPSGIYQVQLLTRQGIVNRRLQKR